MGHPQAEGLMKQHGRGCGWVCSGYKELEELKALVSRGTGLMEQADEHAMLQAREPLLEAVRIYDQLSKLPDPTAKQQQQNNNNKVAR